MTRVFEQFIRKSAAEEWLRDYLRQYPANPYGTRLNLSRDRMSQHWTVSGHRFGCT